MECRTPTVFVVDDDDAVRTSMAALVTSVGLNVETFYSAEQFLAAYKPDYPGCLILDVRMTGMGGLELQQLLKDRGASLPVIVITGHGDVPVAVRAMKNGAQEFIEKPFSKDMLLEHIRRAIALDAQRREAAARTDELQSRLDSLTPRERQVLDGVVSGKVNKQIARDLNLSCKTIEVHRANVMRKMKADSLAELVEQVVSMRVHHTDMSVSVC